jgi:dihydrofolate reductase
MGRVIYSMGMSLDGFVAGPDGEIDWTMPDAELHRFHNERVGEQSAQLCGRRLYEAMLYWETVDQNPESDPIELEFAEIWQALPKVVFSRTLSSLEGNYRLATRDPAAELDALRGTEAGAGDIGVGGAHLAWELARLGLIDAYQLFVYPVALGAGTPYFPRDLDKRIELELVETRTFPSRVTYLHYRRP